MLVLAGSALAGDVRFALWHAPFSRDGPGVLLRDLQKGDASLAMMADEIRKVDADIVVLTKVDFDARGLALAELRNMIDDGHAYSLALRTNAGVPTGHDIDADGRLGEPEDAQAYGLFPGQGALAILSRFPIAASDATSLNTLLWKDLPGTHMTPSDTGWQDQRLSSGGHWVVPVDIRPDIRLTLLVGHAGAPVFDGPEDRNGRRNLDELRLWDQIIAETEASPLVFMANTNLDPTAGEGYRDAMAEFLKAGRFHDPVPDIPTAIWDRPGPMRVSYLLPSVELAVRGARVWPLLEGQKHRLITVDIDFPDASSP